MRYALFWDVTLHNIPEEHRLLETRFHLVLGQFYYNPRKPESSNNTSLCVFSLCFNAAQSLGTFSYI